MDKCRRLLFTGQNIKRLCIGILLFFLMMAIPFYSQADETEDTESTESTESTEEEVYVGVPTNLSVEIIDTDDYNGEISVYLTWDEPAGIKDTPNYNDHNYTVQVSIDGDWDNVEYESNTWLTSTSYSLDMGEKYCFRVRTVCETYEYVEEDYYYYWYSGYDYDEVYSDWSETVYVIGTYEAPNLISAKSSGATSITLTWEANEYIYGESYRIFRADSADGTYKKIASITNKNDVDEMTYTDKKVKTGVKYYYKVCQYGKSFTYKKGELSNTRSATPKPQRISTLTADAAGYTSISLSWEKSEKGVDGYVIYQATSKNGKYKKIKNISDRNTTTYTKRGLIIGKKYYYKIAAYSIVDGKKVFGKESKRVNAVPMVLAPDITSVKATDVTKASISWSKAAGASGYVIYYTSSTSGKYRKLATVAGGNNLSYAVTGLSNGTTYYFKVRAYRTVNGKNYLGKISEAEDVLMDKLGYENESYESRCNRLWGQSEYYKYASESEAKSNMVTISVKVWDINSSNHKYTKTMYLTVNKNIAPTVRQIFREIYYGKEKFPIHSLGGYRWCGSSSSSEHNEGLAIDINPNENAQFSSDGTVLVGSFYKPGESPYSITSDGDVVRAFYKYGFGWGNWFSRPDYMHFSYFWT